MRKNHHGKKDRLVKRVFALCLALAVICTCLVPVFATDYKEVVGSGSEEAAYPDEEVAGFGGDEEVVGFGEDEAAGFGEDFPAVEDGEPREVYDDSESTGSSESSSGNYTVEHKDDATVYVLNTDPSSSTVTEWSDEDAVVDKPVDEEVVSGDEIKKLQDMVVYRFWLKELNANDLQDITAQAQINNMTESEYLARNGEVLWGLYFIQAVPRAETIADYSSYIENPSSNRDPKGELRLFDYWYTLDEFGNRVRLNLTDPTSNILDDKTTTVNVYAAWKDGTVGSDEEEKVDHEDLVDKNPVPVNLTAKAAASYVDEKGKEQSVNLPVEVKNLPSAADHVSVSHMGDNSMTEFCNTYKSELQGMLPLLGLKISPKNAKGETVQPANGQKATVTVSGLNELPDIAEMEEAEALTVDALKVLHKKDDGSVETLDVLSYQNGILTFETTSFSPFVVALAGGYDTELLDERASYADETSYTVKVNKSIQISGKSGQNHNWRSSDNSVATVSYDNKKATVTGVSKGTVTITHKYEYKKYIWSDPEERSESFTITVEPVYAAIYFLSSPDGVPGSNDRGQWSPTSDTSELLAEINVAGATWVDGTYAGSRYITNIKSNVGSYIDLWPDGVTSGGTWTLKKTDTKIVADNKTAFNYVLDSVWDKYEASVRNSLGVSNLAKTDISEIKLKAFKISQNNSDKANQWYHIDCTIDIVSDKVFAARFSVKYLDDTDYTSVDAKNYLTGSKVSNTTVVDDPNAKIKVPSTIKDKNGVIYQLKGWYPENAVGGPYDENREQNLTGGWGEGYRPSTEELADGTVNFYAEYVPVSADLTISKTVTGMLGDTDKAFTFQILNGDNQPVTLTNDNCQFGDGSGTLLESSTDGKFTLKHGGTVTIKNLPVGTYTVTELETSTDELKNYKTTWLLDNGSASSNETENSARTATVEMKSEKRSLDFTNECTLQPDLGVLLDTLPYIVILAVVAGGVALLMLRKRRKEDD